MADNLHPDLKNRPVAWRRLLLPNEHGSWAFFLEPLFLGLLVAFSPAALWLSLAVFLGFISRKPAKFSFATASPSPLSLRAPARLLLLALSLGAAFCLVGAIAVSRWQVLIPVIVCFPALLVFALREREGQTRALTTELIATGLCSFPLVSIALADKWDLASALSLGCVSLARAWPSLLFVRACLRRARGETNQLLPALLAQVFAPLVLAGLAQQNLVPPAIVALNAVLSLRACFFLLSNKSNFTAKQLGIIEVGWGTLYVLGATAVYRC
ncbi:MAG: YwiC-like family protein [Nibricoccus sp.]